MSNKKNISDPFAEREASKYPNPIPSREAILELLDGAKGPLSQDVIAQQLGLEDAESLEALRRRLIAMARDGQIVGNRKGDFGAVHRMNLMRGRVQGHRDGYGFLIVGDTRDDIYLSNRQMRKVFDGDEVLVRLDEQGFRGRKEGSIIQVITRNTESIVGRYFVEHDVHFVKPDNPRNVHDINIPVDQTAHAKPGQLVVATILEYPQRDTLAIGKITEVLGDHLAPGMEIDVAIRNHGIPHQWPAEVVQEVDLLPTGVSAQDCDFRVDLRHLPLVTIDGEDARDFDDAVYCEVKKSGGWRLYVAIADVSHYVHVNSALDKEATVRGNSVYFPDFVVPMLPEALSNGLCSLNPHVDRLCMVCEMTISAQGRITGYTFYEAVMHSKARLTYTLVGQLLAEREKSRSALRQQYQALIEPLDHLQDLFHALRASREMRGAIDFETQETRILFDDQRKIKQIVPIQRNDAHKLIEECMLAANVCAAKFLEQQNVVSLYRVHEGPKEQKLELLKEYLSGLGLGFRKRTQIAPQDYQDIMLAIAGRPDAHLIQTRLLRSMNQAVYQPDNHGHFGLAYDAYTHFTSPIRRYPDLLVHRAIRSVIRSSVATKKVKRLQNTPVQPLSLIYPYQYSDMLMLGEQCSMSERRADDATRDVVSWLKCEYLQDRVGEVFDGVIASVVGFGLFVELKDLFVEGLVHITALPHDYYVHDAAQARLVGERTRRMFTLGDELRVKVINVNLDERKIDFELVGVKSSKARTKFKVSPKAKQLATDHDEQQKRKSRKSKKINKTPTAVEPNKKLTGKNKLKKLSNAAKTKSTKSFQAKPVQAKPSPSKSTLSKSIPSKPSKKPKR